MSDASITICVPALNEAAHLRAAVEGIRAAVSRHFGDWEILIFNDGSTDDTGPIAEALAREDDRIWVIHHETPRNVGACYHEAIEYARKRYLVLFPGDNENDPAGLERLFALAGTADAIIPYTENPEVRPWHRRLISRLFTAAVNLLSGLRLRYYNGTVLHRVDLLRGCRARTLGFGYQADLLVQLLKRGHTYREVAIPIRPRPGRRSRALRLRNLADVARFLAKVPL